MISVMDDLSFESLFYIPSFLNECCLNDEYATKLNCVFNFHVFCHFFFLFTK